jgi:KEOPS complex subunit Cgi121
MLIRVLEGYEMYIAILGVADLRIDAPDTLLQALREATQLNELQILDAEKVAGADHLIFAAVNALNAFKNKINVTRSVAMETLLYASGQRQIRRAIEMLGVSEHMKESILIAFTKEKDQLKNFDQKVSEVMKGTLTDRVLEEWSDEKVRSLRRNYGITDLAIEATRRPGERVEQAITRLIIEKVALLSTEV